MRYLILLFSLFHFCLLSQQKELTIQECIEVGVKNKSLFLAQQSTIDRSVVNLYYGKYSFLPTISASTSYNINFGRKLDPFTNTFGVNSVYSNSYGLTTQLELFQGFRYFKQNRLFEQTSVNSRLDLERTIERTKNQILEKCFNIWKVQLKIEQQHKIINNLTIFKDRQTELVHEGRLSGIDTLRTAINIKTQTIALINLKQQLAYETINLNYFLGLPLMQETKLEPFQPTLTKFEITLDEYYQVEDLKNKQTFLELENRVNKTQFIPSLSFYGNVGTGYSTNNKDYNVSGFPTIPYSTQIPNNAYQGIGFSLNIPIFNKFEWHKTQRLYEIAKTEQTELIKLKEVEFDKKKLEIENQKKYVSESLAMQKEILHDKETIYLTSQMIYLEGKIRLSEVETVETEYFSYFQTIQDLEVEMIKLNAIKIRNNKY